MAVAARQENREYYYAPVTRVYSHGATAVAAQPAYRPQPREEQPEAAPAAKPKQQQRVKAQPAISPLQRVLATVVICAVAAALLFVLVRYERIADEYAVVNELKDDIEEANLSLAALNVELQLAASLDDAKAVAERMGMDYPTADQIHKVGAPLVTVLDDNAGAASNLSPQNQG